MVQLVPISLMAREWCAHVWLRQGKIVYTAHIKHLLLRGCLIFLAIVAPLAGDGLIPPLDSKQAQQARKILEDFKSNPKGPYLQIRWFCKDGSVQPPAGTPCKSRGGGIQYAELSPPARMLSKWNLDVYFAAGRARAVLRTSQPGIAARNGDTLGRGTAALTRRGRDAGSLRSPHGRSHARPLTGNPRSRARKDCRVAAS